MNSENVEEDRGEEEKILAKDLSRTDQKLIQRKEVSIGHYVIVIK